MIKRREFTQWGLAGLMAPMVTGSAHAADAYPNQPIRVIVTSSAGGLLDTMARTIAESVGKTLGQSVIVEARTGANGVIGATAVRQAPPDGYTLLFTVNSLVLAPLLASKPPYDVFKDFVPVALANYGLLVFVVGAPVPANSMSEFVALAKSKPGKLSFGSAGQGSSGHLYGEMLKRDNGLQMTHVPYKGSPPLMTDILGGQVECGFVTLGDALPFYKSGQAKLLGVFGTHRMPLAPKVPTFSEQGFAGYEHGGFWGFFAPAGTPKAVVTQWESAVHKAVAQPALQQHMLGLGLEPSGAGADELLAAVRRENLLWSKLLKDLNLKLD